MQHVSGLVIVPGGDIFLHRSTGLHILLCACTVALHQATTTATELSTSRYSGTTSTSVGPPRAGSGA